MKIANAKDVPPGGAIAVEVAGRRIALFNVGGRYYAIDDTCTHRGGPLSEGSVDGTVVTCPWHSASFDLTTGGVVDPPANDAVARYTVRQEGDELHIDVP